MTDALIGAAAFAVACPLLFLALRHARRHRVQAVIAASFLLVFGVNVAQVSPPPPREVEAEQHEEEDAGDDEPK